MPSEIALPKPPDRAEQSVLEPGIARAAFEALPQASFVLDEAEHILLHTKRAARIYARGGAKAAMTLDGTPFARLTYLDLDTLKAKLRDCLAGGTITLPMYDARRVGIPKDVIFHLSLMRIPDVRRQLIMLSQDHLSANAVVLQNAQGRFDREISRGDALEAQIADLQRVVLSMETFTHAASHDLRTPINALSGLLSLLTDQFSVDLPEEAQTYLDHMTRATTQMEMLTTKLLTYARSTSAPLAVQQVALLPAVESAVALVDPAMRARAFEISVQGPQVDIMAEHTMLQILVGNVVANALKNGSEERPLSVTLTTAIDGEGATLTIADTGTGFDPAQTEAIFSPFVRLDDSVPGSGLGLATCVEICRRHGWAITAHSDGENGATFILRFPVALIR